MNDLILPKGWEWKKLGEISEVKRGVSKHRPRNDKSLLGGNYPFIQTGDVRNAKKYLTLYSETYNEKGLAQSKLWEKGTICLTIAANIGDVAILGIDACFPDSVVGISSKKHENEFIYYYLTTLKSQLEDRATKAAQMNLNVEKLVEFEIPLPPLPEQRRIVAKIDAAFTQLDEAIQLQKQNLARTGEMKKSVLEEVFEKDKWGSKKIGEVCKLLNGRAYKQEELLESGPTPVLRVGNFFSNRGWYYSNLELEENKYCDNGDLLYAWSASFGPKIWDGDKVIYHYHIWKILPFDCILKEYLFRFLLWDTDRIKDGAKGVGMLHMTKGDMEQRKIILPPLPEQQKIVAHLDQTFAQIDTLQAEQNIRLQHLESLKSSILAEAFQGKL
jgi:type I restriction enzyme S subunit